MWEMNHCLEPGLVLVCVLDWRLFQHWNMPTCSSGKVIQQYHVTDSVPTFDCGFNINRWTLGSIPWQPMWYHPNFFTWVSGATNMRKMKKNKIKLNIMKKTNVKHTYWHSVLIDWFYVISLFYDNSNTWERLSLKCKLWRQKPPNTPSQQFLKPMNNYIRLYYHAYLITVTQ